MLNLFRRLFYNQFWTIQYLNVNWSTKQEFISFLYYQQKQNKIQETLSMFYTDEISAKVNNQSMSTKLINSLLNYIKIQLFSQLKALILFPEKSLTIIQQFIIQQHPKILRNSQYQLFYFIIILMRGSKITNRSPFLSKDQRPFMLQQSPQSIQYAERNIIMKGKLIRRKRPFKINKTNSQHNRPLNFNQIAASLSNKQRQSCDQVIRKQSLKIQSKLSTYDILNYLQMRCSQVFFRTHNNFQKKEPPPSYNGKIGVSLKRFPSSDSKSRLQSANGKIVSSLQNKSTEVQSIKQSFQVEALSTNIISKSYSPANIMSGRKNYINPLVRKSQNKESKSKTEAQPQKKVIINKQKPLLSYNYMQLKHVKSQSFAMIQADSQQLVLINKGKTSLEIASITKIMTAYVVFSISQKLGIDIKEQKVEVQKYVQKTTGTSAELIHGDIYSVEQLLYGLLLPSGNDAALVLADWGGSLINKNNQTNSEYRQNIITFVQQMTKTAKHLGLKDTKYGNPHGLPSLDGKSTALDQCKLAAICIKNPSFKQIIKTKLKKFQITNSDGQKRQIIWENTNKLLRRPGFVGFKTGITVTAGPCLLSAYEFKQKTYILTVLRCNKVSRRFKDSRKILYWALCKLYVGNTYFQEGFQLQELNKNRKQLDSDYSQDQNQFVYGQQDCGQYSRRKNILSNDL